MVNRGLRGATPCAPYTSGIGAHFASCCAVMTSSSDCGLRHDVQFLMITSRSAATEHLQSTTQRHTCVGALLHTYRIVGNGCI